MKHFDCSPWSFSELHVNGQLHCTVEDVELCDAPIRQFGNSKDFNEERQLAISLEKKFSIGMGDKREIKLVNPSGDELLLSPFKMEDGGYVLIADIRQN